MIGALREQRDQMVALAGEHAGGHPRLAEGYRTVAAALELAAATVEADPTLLRHRRAERTCTAVRWLDLLGELARQARPVGGQVLVAERWEALGAEPDARARERGRNRLGRVNHQAPREFAQLVARVRETAERVAVLAYDDPPTPEQRAHLLADLMPSEGDLGRVASRLRAAAAALHQDLAEVLDVGGDGAPADARRLSAAARRIEALAAEVDPGPAAPPVVCGGCGQPLPAVPAGGAGRPRRYCGDACRQRAHRAARRTGAPPRA
ncbi:hypothetical protein DEF23_17295 [Marinitenerispora sediminis]|uniref:Uncharacterized protein n=1 Tax=Marinitenerispora sediminis TaxID=1931232 RepID=A0A368T4E2_9ACTN|nr:hypothetical protein DEF28_19945 [Marinitenerispora sediminis]RCV53555.1 hypothetical protein DEF23_17295 [Marinitenerispora sediminis]RCV57653.1 hypothetical protein DEF24_14855 [Marinitenerispora sediminis]